MISFRLPFIAPLAGGLLGMVLGWYAGVILLIPAALTLLVVFFLYKACRVPRGFLLWSLALQAGHCCWIAAGLLMLGRSLDLLSAVEFSVVLFGLGWLFFSRSRRAVLFLTVYQIASFVLNIAVVLQVPWATTLHKALLVHMTLRLLALYCMFRLLEAQRKAGA